MPETFNAAIDPWIQVLKNSRSAEVSLIELFKDAHLIEKLDLETTRHDISMLRFITGIAHHILYEMAIAEQDPNFDPDDRDIDKKDLRQTYEKIFRTGKFDPDFITAYFTKDLDAYDPFNDKRPFLQTDRVPRTWYHDKFPKHGVIRLCSLKSTIGESDSKPGVFMRAPIEQLTDMTLSEIVREMIVDQNFGLGAAKTKPLLKKNLEIDDATFKVAKYHPGIPGSTQQTWLIGKNLFETIMINIPVYTDLDISWFAGPTAIIDRPSHRDLLYNVPRAAALYTCPRHQWILESDIKDEPYCFAAIGYHTHDVTAGPDPHTVYIIKNDKDNDSSKIIAPSGERNLLHSWDFPLNILVFDEQLLPQQHKLTAHIQKLKEKGLIEQQPLCISTFQKYKDGTASAYDTFYESKFHWPKALYDIKDYENLYHYLDLIHQSAYLLDTMFFPAPGPINKKPSKTQDDIRIETLCKSQSLYNPNDERIVDPKKNKTPTYFNQAFQLRGLDQIQSDMLQKFDELTQRLMSRYNLTPEKLAGQIWHIYKDTIDQIERSNQQVFASGRIRGSAGTSKYDPMLYRLFTDQTKKVGAILGKMLYPKSATSELEQKKGKNK